MAMVVATLQADLIKIFNTMNDMMEGGGDRYKAAEIAKAIKTYILTGQTTTTNDTGATSAGSYKGASAGTMTIDNSQLEDDLFATFDAKYNDDDLAAHMATDIDNACKEADTVTATSTGTVTTGSGATSPFSGPAIGKFAGTKATIETMLKTCFKTMYAMTAVGGNEHYALQLSIAVDTYLKAGTITVELKPPFTSGSGSGKIA